MILEHWVADATRLVSELPPTDPITTRARFLLDYAIEGGIEINPEVLSSSTRAEPKDTSFLVAERAYLSQSSCELGELCRTREGIAITVHPVRLDEALSIIILPPHSTASSLGNAHIFLHELEHITEVEEGVSMHPNYCGTRERRAYLTNSRIIKSLDTSDYDRYIENWPVSFNNSSEDAFTEASIRFHDKDCPKPPTETHAYQVWQEGPQSRRVLQCIGRMSVFEKLTSDLPASLTNKLVAGLVK